jgi:hypothetical protein
MAAKWNQTLYFTTKIQDMRPLWVQGILPSHSTTPHHPKAHLPIYFPQLPA